ncbi:MAG: hypothetical protein ABL897_01770 [Hyphomicrobium sp.]
MLYLTARRAVRASLRRVSTQHVAVLFAVSLAVACSPTARGGPAIGQFEIKSVGAEPGETEWQSQNDFSFGNPQRRLATDANGDLNADGNSVTRQRNALEVELGITSFLKTRIGISVQRDRMEDPATAGQADAYDELTFDGFGFETNWTLLPRKGDGIGVGFIIEYDRPATSDEAEAITAGPLFELAKGPWLASFSPLITRYMGGAALAEDGPGNRLDFGYAARIMYQHSAELSLAVEAYGSVERLGSTGRVDDSAEVFGDFNQHRIGPILYWTFEDKLAKQRAEPGAHGGDDDDGRKVETTVGIGAFFGLNDTTADTTLKFSIEVAY